MSQNINKEDVYFMKKISLLGSTGSIGTQTLEIVRNHSELKVVALTANSNVELMEKQIREFSPKLAVMYDEAAAQSLREKVSDLNVKVSAGMEGLIEAATMEESEVVLTAVVGMIGIRPTIAAIKARKNIALANKETLVCAGHIIMPLVKEYGVSLLPVDSEHSAIFQSLNGENHGDIEKILLTASGGPFRNKSKDELSRMTVDDALAHPNWNMGSKITIDSATLVNKGLEVMEAAWLFNVTLDKIQVIIHPQSIIHSMVQYRDGAVMAELGVPDMKLPIQYALFYPNRPFLNTKRVDFYELAQMTFEKPDPVKFEGFALAMEAARIGGSMPTAFNAANEKAVELFLARKIGFTDIPRLINKAMEMHSVVESPDVDTILKVQSDAEAAVLKG